MDKELTSSFLFRLETKSRESEGSFLLRAIPSAIKTDAQLEEERKLSLLSRKRRSEISHKFAERRRASLGGALLNIKKPAAQKSVVIEGAKTTVSVRSDLDTDQLCCQYNPDYTLFATGGADGIIRVFDTTTGELVTSLLGGKETEGRTSCVTCIKCTPSGKSSTTNAGYTCSYVNGCIKCFNYNTKECSFTIKEKRQTYGLTYHPKLPKFITYGDDLKINLYDNETQAKERIFQGSMVRDVHDGPSSRVFAARFNPSSNTEFLTGGWDDTVMLWDLRSPNAARYISGPHICGEGLDIDKGGNQVLTCSWRKEEPLQLWDYSSFKLLTTMLPDHFTSKLYCGRFMNQDFIACGGGYPSIVRLLDRRVYKSRAMITGLPSDVYHLCIGKPKLASAAPKKIKSKTITYEDNDDDTRPDMSRASNLLFACGSRIYEADFS